MKRKVSVCLAVLITALLLVATTAQGATAFTKGTVMTAAAPFDFTAVIPEEMESFGGAQAFAYGYRSDSMLVGLTPSAERSFDAFRENRMGEAFMAEIELTINGFAARKYTMPPESGVMAVYAIKTSDDANITEIAFYPKDMAAAAANEASADKILNSVRSRSQTFATESAGNNWSIMFNHNDTGLSTVLPTSFVKAAHPQYEDTIVEYRNDYVLLLLFGYEATMDQYIEEYDMNSEEFHVSDTVVNGVKVHIFEPKSEQVSTDIAYVVAEGRDGSLLEFIFGATDLSEVEENWMYINQIIANIAAF